MIAFTADISKMFRQILVCPQQHHLQCVLWRSNPKDPIQEYALQTVTYGTSSAPFLAQRVLHQLADDEESCFPSGARTLKNDFYMDDCMSRGSTVQEVQQIVHEVLEVCKSGGMSLRKFSSYSDEVLSELPVELIEKSLILPIENDAIVKTLGLLWNTSTDVFQFKIIALPESATITKRNILSEISKLLDPMGWLSPVVISSKILMQNVWKLHSGWDDNVCPSTCSKWNAIKRELTVLEETKIPRCINVTNPDNFELCGFSDASEKAYSAVCYLKVRSTVDVKINLLTSKTRVSPLKVLSLPTLELCGAVLLCELMQSVNEALKLPISKLSFWSDSMIVLNWIKSRPDRWVTFVANRVTRMQELFSIANWNHVSGHENPADCASRGLTPQELIDHKLWWNGPTWLRNDQYDEAKIDAISVNEAAKAEKKNKIHVHMINCDDPIISRFSSVSRMKQVLSYCIGFLSITRSKIKFKKNLACTIDPIAGPPQVTELKTTLKRIIRLVQRESFEEYRLILAGKEIPKSSKILTLSPFLDDEKLLPVGGRITKADIPMGKQKPLLLPKNSKLTELLIWEAHQLTLHGGCQLVQNFLAQNYWIIRGRDTIRFQLRKCVICVRHRAQTANQLMADLPAQRVNPSRPFSIVGVDYAGPFLLKSMIPKSKTTVKAYLSLFVCFATRALHLEVVSSLSTEAFLATLKRFVARRGCPTQISSDCGSNFIGAAADLKELQQFVSTTANNDKISNFLSTHEIQWHFNPPASPHFGGLWEAGVKSVKFHICRIVGCHRLTFEELQTVITQIEATLNSRPLSPMTSDPNDFVPLTPSHFLIGGSPQAVQELSLIDLKKNRLNRWQLVEQMSQHFWNRWSNEYLTRLQQRPKWLKGQRDIHIDDMVLIKSELTSPMNWPIARVIKTHPGSDGLTRTVTLRTSTGELKRPIVKLVLLPIFNSDEDSTENDVMKLDLYNDYYLLTCL